MGRATSTGKCPICKVSIYLDKNNIKNLGAFWHSVWVATCPYCGDCFVVHETKDANWQALMKEHYLKWKQPKQDIPQFYLMLGKRNNKSKADIEQEIKNNEIYESAIQNYVFENYQMFGITSIEGPFEVGPDFKGVWNGKTVEIEVERAYTDYKQHGHHKQHSFEKVEILICLDNKKPTKRSIQGLPQNIWYIDQKHFLTWYMVHRIKYAKVKQIETLINILRDAILKNIFFLLNIDEEMEDLELMTIQDEVGFDLEKVAFDWANHFVIEERIKLDAVNFISTNLDMKRLFEYCKLHIREFFKAV
jgi:hypothetical protein